MPVFVIEQSNEKLNTHTGLSIIGLLLSKTELDIKLNGSLVPARMEPTIKHNDVVISYLGLLCQGKNSFDDIEEFRDNEFFALALNLDDIPSSPTLRQRFDQAGEQWNEIIDTEMINLLCLVDPIITPCLRDLVPLDIDVSPFDNSKTKKEGVARTYKGFDGYTNFCLSGTGRILP